MIDETALVVFSGGQDSTTCLFWAKREFKQVCALSFRYGQKHEREVELARRIAEGAGVSFTAMELPFIGTLGHNLTDIHVLTLLCPGAIFFSLAWRPFGLVSGVYATSSRGYHRRTTVAIRIVVTRLSSR